MRMKVKFHVLLENAGGVVHRAAHDTGEGQDGGVLGRVAYGVGGLELGAAGGLGCQVVGPGAMQSGGSYGLVGVYHDLVVGGASDAVQEVVDRGLVIVVGSAGDDGAYVAALDYGIVVVLHELVCPVEVTLVVEGRAGGLMVHDELDALALGVVTELSHIEVGVGSEEVEYELLELAEPVFPLAAAKSMYFLTFSVLAAWVPLGTVLV